MGQHPTMLYAVDLLLSILVAPRLAGLRMFPLSLYSVEIDAGMEKQITSHFIGT